MTVGRIETHEGHPLRSLMYRYLMSEVVVVVVVVDRRWMMMMMMSLLADHNQHHYGQWARVSRGRIKGSNIKSKHQDTRYPEGMAKSIANSK